MKKFTWIAGGIAAALTVAALVWAFAPRPTLVETGTVSEGRFEATVDEDARTRVRERYIVSAALAGTLGRIALREGDEVRAGDVLAALTPLTSPLTDERTLRAQRAGVAAAEAGIEGAEARLARARVATAQAKSDLERSESLARQGYVAAAKLDADRLAMQAAQREVEAATAEGHVARHQLEQARAALATVLGTGGAQRAFKVLAPVSGRVLKVAQTSEGSVGLGTPLLELGDTERLEIVAELLTTEALRVQPGQRVHIERWGGEGVLQGKVRRVEPAAFTKVSALGVEEQRVRALIDITSPAEQWRTLGDGFRVSVRIVTQQGERALLAPLGALFPRPEGGMALFVVDGTRARLTPVELVARSLDAAWIKSGVEAGAVVVVYPPSSLADGTRVRRRP
jgi:HlyD family secretion protein